MIKNYFKIAIRNILKHKSFSFINITGLTIGIASCIIIFQHVAFEYSYDRFNENAPDIYRVLTAMTRTGDESPGGAFTGFALAPALNDAVPEIMYSARLHPEYEAAIVSNPAFPDKVFEEEDIFYADPSFLKMFSFPVAEGSNSLEPGTAILSRAVAEKYFGSANPIGEVIKVTGQINKSYIIAGIFKDIPLNSHLKFEILLPMDDLLRGETYTNEPEGGWSWNNFLTYIQLYPDADPLVVERKMTQTLLRYRGEILKQQGYSIKVLAQPLTDVHLNSEIEGPKAVMGSYQGVYFFSVVGLITLLIALVNYVNLATARSLNRAREVGMRKVVGAQKKQLVFQFLCEAALTNFAAAALAIVVVEATIPLVNNIAETTLTGVMWSNPWFWLICFFTFILCTILAGVYPGILLSSFNPVKALKGKAGSFITQLWLRRSLVILQFAASVFLIGGTIIVSNQLSYMRDIDLGLNLEQVLTLKGPRVLPEGTEYPSAVAVFLHELEQIPNVRQTATSSSVPGEGFNWNGASVRKSEDDPANAIRGVATYIDTAFAQLYGLNLIAGNGFNDISSTNTDDSTWLVIVNETAVKSLGIKSSMDAVGQQLNIGGYESRIVGVYQDFNWSSAHTPRQNIIFGNSNEGGLISLRVETSNLSNTLKNIEKIYNRLFPGNVFNFAFLNETFDAQYKNDQRFATLVTIFAGLAIFIACLGLFGLADFTTKQRTKEIGVRKVLGATIPEIVLLLSRDFLTLVILAVVIATPVTYFLMAEWLEGFAYRINVGPLVFIITGALVLLIALLTVSYQSIRTATANPVNSLRYE